MPYVAQQLNAVNSLLPHSLYHTCSGSCNTEKISNSRLASYFQRRRFAPAKIINKLWLIFVSNLCNRTFLDRFSSTSGEL